MAMGRSSKSGFTTAEPTVGFGALAGRKYALLITYRKTGEGVPSPIWFGRDDVDRVYFDTEKASAPMPCGASPTFGLGVHAMN